MSQRPPHVYPIANLNNWLCLFSFTFSVLALVVAIVGWCTTKVVIPPEIEYAVIRHLVNQEADNWKYMQQNGDAETMAKSEIAMKFARKLQDAAKEKVNYPD
jgi:hypothetical protein